MANSNGRQHPLLIYRRLYALWRPLALVITLLWLLLWWFAPAPFDSELSQLAVLTAAGLFGLFFLYTLAAPRLTFVQCRPTHLLLSTPLFRLAVSYSRIRTTRPVLFDPPRSRGGQELLVGPLRGLTAVAVDLNRYPISVRWLRLWLNEFLVPDNFIGLVLLTPNWMELSRDIDTFRTHWKARRLGEGSPGLTSLLPGDRK